MPATALFYGGNFHGAPLAFARTTLDPGWRMCYSIQKLSSDLNG